MMMPEAWRIATKRENGNFERLHHPTYTDPAPVTFAVLWGRNLQGGRLHAPLAEASASTCERYNLTDSDITAEA
jgi:hypothetical protein